jgi:hypothetical protein
MLISKQYPGSKMASDTNCFKGVLQTFKYVALHGKNIHIPVIYAINCEYFITFKTTVKRKIYKRIEKSLSTIKFARDSL